MAPYSLPFDPGNGSNPLTKIWIPYALRDSLLFLATLHFAEMHFDSLKGRPSNSKALARKGEIIRLINAKLQSNDAALADETIAAVSMIAGIEVCKISLLCSSSTSEPKTSVDQS